MHGGVGSGMAASHLPDETLLSEAHRIGPLIREHAAATEREGVPAPAVLAAMVEARLFDAYRPAELGGLDAGAVTLVELVEEVSKHDGSTGWCLGMAGIIGGLAASRLPDEGAAEVFPTRDTVLCAGGFVPRLSAQPTDGGYRVSGRFPFASGCRFASWLVVTGMVEGTAGPTAMRTFCVRTAEVEILDNWHVAGLEGTSSNDLQLDDVFVPEARSFGSVTTPRIRGGAFWELPVLSAAAVGHLGFALGSGRRALDEIAAYAGTQRFASSAPIAERSVFQRDFARAHTALRAARLAAFESMERVVEAGTDASATIRAELIASLVYAYQTATAAAEFAFRAGGASSLYREGALQRCFRDLQAGSQHVVASDEGFERAGQVLLGLDPPGFL